MASSFAKECTELKHKYDNCFNDWYANKFLRGEGRTNGCQELFNQYRTCVETQLKKRGLDKLLDEAKADESGFDNSSIQNTGGRRK